MAREVLGDMKNVEVVGFASLLTEFVRKQARAWCCAACARSRTSSTSSSSPA